MMMKFILVILRNRGESKLYGPSSLQLQKQNLIKKLNFNNIFRFGEVKKVKIMDGKY